MKMLWMIDRFDSDKEPPKYLEYRVSEEAKSKGLEMPAVQQGWRKEGGYLIEISSKEFPGSKPIWYWEVK